jgi:hypothetical protein
MFIRGVDIGHDRDPWASGGFADVFRGKHNGLEVAIKRLRVFSEDRAKVNAVRSENHSSLETRLNMLELDAL